MSKPRATWFSVDVEANGPVPGLYDMVSLAVVVVHEDGQGHFELGAEVSFEVRPTAPWFDAEAAAVHGLDQERLRREGLERRVLCERLASWVAEQTRPGTEPIFVGHNAPFDWSMVSWTFAAERLPNPFGYKALCTKALATGVLGLHWLDSGKDELTRRLGLEAEDLGSKHRADYDARFQAKLLKALLEAIHR